MLSELLANQRFRTYGQGHQSDSGAGGKQEQKGTDRHWRAVTRKASQRHNWEILVHLLAGATFS